MNRVVMASGNTGKLREVQQLLENFEVELIPQSEFELDGVEETGLSFVENALLKARHASAVSGLPALADDSGIEVDALGGEPGIYSARYAGVDGKDADMENNARLLMELEQVPEIERTARYQCVIVYLRHHKDPMPLICHGSWEGRILFEERGDNGFGYDPLFYVPTHDCSAGELDPDTKNSISHRGQALRQLVQCWNSRL